MKKTLLVVFAMMLLGAATANAQNAGNHKATIEKGKSAAKRGTVAEAPGSKNFSDALEKKAATSRAKVEKEKLEKAKAEKAKTEKAKTEKAKAEKAKAEKAKTEKKEQQGKAEKSSATPKRERGK